MSSVIMLYGAQFSALLNREHLFEGVYKKPEYKTGDLPTAVGELLLGAPLSEEKLKADEVAKVGTPSQPTAEARADKRTEE